MTTKFTRDQINSPIQTLTEVTFDKYGSHSYACGVLQSMLVDAVQSMPRHKQAEVLQLVATLTEKNKG